jgi:hypothetical protein
MVGRSSVDDWEYDAGGDRSNEGKESNDPRMAGLSSGGKLRELLD